MVESLGGDSKDGGNGNSISGRWGCPIVPCQIIRPVIGRVGRSVGDRELHVIPSINVLRDLIRILIVASHNLIVFPTGRTEERLSLSLESIEFSRKNGDLSRLENSHEKGRFSPVRLAT